MLHATEVKVSDFQRFKEALGSMAEVSIISQYTVQGIRFYDVEVSKDNSVINRIERVFRNV